MNIGVILAGGIGKRFGSLVHKQYLKLNGKEVLSYAIKRMSLCENIDKIILVVDNNEYKSQYIEKKYQVECVCGGETRNHSIKNALDYIKSNYDCDKVLFHDATRPLIKCEYYDLCLNSLDGYDAVVSFQEITDSLCDDKNNFVNRDNYKIIQTPEVFYFKQLYDVFDAESTKTTIVAQLNSPKINFVKSDKFGFKITYPNDLFLAEQLDKINFYELSKNHVEYDFENKNILIFGGTGGTGSALISALEKYKNVNIKAPKSSEVNLKNMTIASLNEYCGNFKPDIIINAAAVSLNDNDGLIETFDDVFSINLKSNIVLIEYIKQLNKEVKFVVMSSSSSTKGRENITNYSASKCALNSVVESQANVLKKQNIYINAIIPEKINTPMIQKLHKTNISTRELLEVNDVVDAILYIVSSNEFGQLIHLRKGL